MAEKLDTQIRREQIAEAALAIIATHGLGKLNAVSVAKRVGLVPSALYRHYRNKESLLDAVLALIEARLLGHVQAVAEGPGDALKRLRNLLDRHIELLLNNPGIPLVIFSQEFCFGKPARRRSVFQVISAYLAAVADIVRKGQHEGCIDPKHDPDAIALLFLGLIQPMAILHHTGGRNFDLGTHSRKTWPMFCAAIGAIA